MTDDGKLNVILLSERLDDPDPVTCTADLARSLCERGHQVFLITTVLPDEDVLSKLGPPVRLCRHLKAWGVGGVMRKWLISELRAFRPDILHTMVPQLGLVGWRIARKLGVPSVVTVYGGDPDGDPWSAGDLCDSSIIAVGQSVREDLVNQCRIRKARITVIYPGVRVQPGKLPDAAAERRTTVAGTLSTLDYVEGHRFLLRAARSVLDRGLELQVLVAGTGSEKRNLRELVAELDLHEAVTFVEDTSRPRQLMEVMDVFVLPTMRGGMNPLVLEAMALGKPVVVSSGGGIFAAVQHNHTGLIFPKGDVEALAAALARLVLKPDFAARIAREGRELVRREFSLDQMVDKTLELYRKLVEERVLAAHGEPGRTLQETR